MPSPANRSATRFAPPTPSRTSSTRTASASREAWRKAPGGSLTLAPERSISGGPPGAMLSPSAVSRATPSEAAFPAKAPKAAGLGLTPSTTMSRPLAVSVTLTLASPLSAQERRKRLFELRQARGDAGRQHRADRDVDQVVGAGAAIAESEPSLSPAKREACAPPAPQRHGPHRLDLGVEPARSQGGDDLLALPAEIGALLQMLEGAAAARRRNAGRSARCGRGSARALRAARAWSLPGSTATLTSSPGSVKGTKSGPSGPPPRRRLSRRAGRS